MLQVPCSFVIVACQLPTNCGSTLSEEQAEMLMEKREKKRAARGTRERSEVIDLPSLR
jgi:hypothetical protein